MGTAAAARDGVKRFPESAASASNASRIRLDRGFPEAVAAITDPNFDEFTRNPQRPVHKPRHPTARHGHRDRLNTGPPAPC